MEEKHSVIAVYFGLNTSVALSALFCCRSLFKWKRNTVFYFGLNTSIALRAFFLFHFVSFCMSPMKENTSGSNQSKCMLKHCDNLIVLK